MTELCSISNPLIYVGSIDKNYNYFIEMNQREEWKAYQKYQVADKDNNKIISLDEFLAFLQVQCPTFAVKDFWKQAAFHIDAGNLHSGKQEFEKAVDHYQKALGILPKDANLHYLLGNVLAGQKKFKQAEEEFKQALQLNPKHIGAYVTLAAISIDRADQLQPNFPQAKAYLEKALSLAPNNSEVHMGLGTYYLARAIFSGRFPDIASLRAAKSHFEKAVQLNPSDKLAWEQLEFVKTQLPPDEKEEVQRVKIWLDNFKEGGGILDLPIYYYITKAEKGPGRVSMDGAINLLVETLKSRIDLRRYAALVTLGKICQAYPNKRGAIIPHIRRIAEEKQTTFSGNKAKEILENLSAQ